MANAGCVFVTFPVTYTLHIELAETVDTRRFELIGEVFVSESEFAVPPITECEQRPSICKEKVVRIPFRQKINLWRLMLRQITSFILNWVQISSFPLVL